jgi:hypothetical protein
MARKKLANLDASKDTWVACGFDVSMSAIAGAGYMYDGTLDKLRGPSIVTKRWNQGEHYFERCKDAARGEDYVHQLIVGLHGVVRDITQVYVAVEEPWPLGMAKRGDASWIKQQAQIQGIFLGSLLRYGYVNLFEVNSQSWKAGVAKELGMRLNREFTKWHVKEWAIKAYGVDDMPDLIQGKHGKKPRPEGSRAKAVQPDDVYDALGVLDWLRTQIEEGS